MPPSLEWLLAVRLDALDAPTREALLLIAAHGRLPVRLLHALGIESDALQRAHVVNVVDADDDVARFAHPLLASTLYQGTPAEARRAAHRRLAAVLDDPIDRGRHLALGAVEPDERLAATLEATIRVAQERGMPIAAAELADHAMRLTPPEDRDDRHRRAIAAARAHLEAGEANRARAIAAELLAGAPPGSCRAEALMLSAELEDTSSAIPLLERR